jgi:dTDP-glucose 4,6-dehydratase
MHPVVTEDLATVRESARVALEALSGSTVLVAGGAGFLPSYIVDSIAYANDQSSLPPTHIVCLDNFKTGLPGRLAHLNGRGDVSFIQHDITQELPPDLNPQFIIHAASIASPAWYRTFPLETIDINVIGTRRLLELGRRSNVTDFLYLSTSEIYGNPPPEMVPTNEEYWGNVSSLGPRACYDESKRLAETLCMTYFRSFQLPVKIVRPFNVYGPRLRLDDRRVVPDLISDAIEHRQLTLFSDGEVTRSFCYVSDAAAAIMRVVASDQPGEVFNVGNDEEVTIRQLAEIIDELSGYPKGIRFADNTDPNYLTDSPQRRCPDLTKIRESLGWSPKVSLREGIERTIRFFQQASANND